VQPKKRRPLLRSDADNLEGLTVNPQQAADDIRSASVQSLPEPVADDRHEGRIRAVVIRTAAQRLAQIKPAAMSGLAVSNWCRFASDFHSLTWVRSATGSDGAGQ